MRTLNNRGSKIQISLLALAITAIAPYGAFAQDALLEDAQNVFNSEQLDIDGDYSQPRVSQADKLEKLRKKLEQQNEDMVSKKIEDMRMKEELKLAGKLKAAFNGGMAVDSVSTKAAAVVVAPVPVVTVNKRSNRVIPKFGMTNYSGEGLDLESNISVGLNLETDVHSRISVGLGIQYSAMDITDKSTNNNFLSFSGFNQGREMGYTHLNLELNSKFFMTVDSKIRPYIGIGIGYNRTKLSYNDSDSNQNPYAFTPSFYTDIEDVSSSFVSASASAGAEMSFSDSIGAGLEFRYNRGLTNTTNGSTSSFYNLDQRKLDKLADGINDADQFSIQTGLVIKF